MLRVILIGFLLLANSAWSADARLPTVTGTNLHGNDFTFPDDLYHQHTLLLIGFEHEHHPLIATWFPLAESLSDSEADFGFMEVPTIAQLNAMIRWFIYRGMRSEIEDSAVRQRTVTLHIDKAPFKAALQIQAEDVIQALLVDEEGLVLWRAQGVWNETKEADLRQRLQELSEF